MEVCRNAGPLKWWQGSIVPRKNVCKLSMGVYTNASLHGWMIASLVLQCFQVFMAFSNVSSSLYLADLNLLQATCYIVKHTCAVWSLNRFFGFFFARSTRWPPSLPPPSCLAAMALRFRIVAMTDPWSICRVIKPLGHAMQQPKSTKR